MTQTKHTPGPWEIITWAQTGIENESGIFISGHKSPAYHAPLAKVLENNPPLTSTLETHIDKKEALANARLIAAAPELLEACEEFIRKVDAGEAKSTKSYAQMKAAVAKARGQS